MRHRKSRPPLNQLILSLLYHLTSVRRATRALRALKRSFVDWNELRISHPCEVAAVISSAAWARDAAEQIIWLLREVYEVHNSTCLDFLQELTGPQARSCLQSLPPVDRSLADEVLLLSLGHPVLPLTPAAARMCFRLGLLDNPRPTLKNQRALAKLFEEEHFPAVHLFFCDIAESVCLPDDPLCGQCQMRRTCPSRR
jgi:endonuclease III